MFKLQALVHTTSINCGVEVYLQISNRYQYLPERYLLKVLESLWLLVSVESCRTDEVH